MTAYSATVSREGKWWMVRVPAIDGLTQARRVSEAALMARELIAVTLDLAPADVEVALTFEPIGAVGDVGAVGDISAEVSRIAGDRARAAELERRASRDLASLAKTLRAQGIPGRDIGALLGMSHQRAQQLVSE